MRILISGGAGFVGANLLRHFISQGHEAYGLVRKESNRWRLQGIEEKNLVFADLTNRTSVFGAVRAANPEVIIHTAIYGGYPYEKDTERIFQTNLNGTMNLLDAAIDSGVKLFINTGTSSEYGAKDHPIKESEPLAPDTDYGISKALATQYCAFKANGGTKIIGLRPFSVYGYFEEGKRLIPHLLYCAIKKEKAHLSSLKNVRDFVFIEDVMAAYDAVIRSAGSLESGSIFNIASGIQYSIEDVVRLTGVQVELDASVRAPEKMKMWQADITAAAEKLGWMPRTGLVEGLQKSREWMDKNLELYETDLYDRSKRA